MNAGGNPVLAALVIARLFLMAALVSAASAQPNPVTSKQRLDWWTVSTLGPTAMGGGVISSSYGTLTNSPVEYGPTWKGFGKRYGIRTIGLATSNAMEVGLGALWGEDPRYVRVGGGSFSGRMKQVVKMTFTAKFTDGSLRPAYARYAAISGSNFLSNTWRADSEADAGDAAIRVGFGFLAEMTGNAFAEFWPDVRRRLFHR